MLDDIVGLMLVESVVEGFGGILNGVLRGIGKQKMSLFIMLVVFYIFFQPISLYFKSKHLVAGSPRSFPQDSRGNIEFCQVKIMMRGFVGLCYLHLLSNL